MKPEICSGRLNLVACIVVYRHTSNGFQEFLTIQRNDKKFAFIGGMGACCLSQTMYEFAKKEFDFDMGTNIPIEELQYVESTLDSKGETLTLYFCYYDDKKNEQELNGYWFSITEIGKLAKNNKIAFDADQFLARFVKNPIVLNRIIE